MKKRLALGAAVLCGLPGLLLSALSIRFARGRRRADEAWLSTIYPRMPDFGEVEHLSILPLADWHTASDELAGEGGVAYLVKADDSSILFDMGFNLRNREPSPLLRNMRNLGVNVGDIDAVFISHPHVDHVGGFKNSRRKTFGISRKPLDLGGVKAYLPCALSNPTTDCVVCEEPVVIAQGVASTGTIPRQLFFVGQTPEHMLAVKVKGMGMVVVVGCGHPTLERIIDRAEMLFDDPIYAVVGGLHLPLTDSRLKFMGVPILRFVGTGKWPWDPINRADVAFDISYLKERNPSLVALSPHDSCDVAIGMFESAFGDAYRHVVVGEKIEIS